MRVWEEKLPNQTKKENTTKQNGLTYNLVERFGINSSSDIGYLKDFGYFVQKGKTLF